MFLKTSSGSCEPRFVKHTQTHGSTHKHVDGLTSHSIHIHTKIKTHNCKNIEILGVLTLKLGRKKDKKNSLAYN